jgi:KDO2-lipid IV(A) lauroyltransferase
MIRIVIVLLWLLHWLPLSWLASIGESLGALLYRVAGSRRRVVLTNLRLCFPEWEATQQVATAQAHFRALGRGLLERSLLWWGSAERLRRIIRLHGTEKIRAYQAAGRPVVLFAPHFIGLDMGGTRITMDFNIVSIYAYQKDPVIDKLLLHGRSRFGDQQLLARQDGARATVKAMKAGRPFYYLPDMDYGLKDSVFVPFFGVSTATITGLSRLSRLAGAVVLPCITKMQPGGAGYDVEIGDPLANFPSDDPNADTAAMNRFLEGWIRTQPEQYYWVHKRFKTRPPGEASFY